MKRDYLHIIGFVALLALGACSSSSDVDQDAVKAKKEEEAKAAVAPKKELPICPQVAIVRSLDDIKDYGNEKPSLEQLVAEARMEGVEGNCGYKDNAIDITFDVHFTAARGPRLGGTHGSFPFFIAIVDPDENILSKEPMTVEFTFPDDTDTITTDKTEPLHVVIPLVKDKWETGPSYQVLLGFQLTHEQLDALRADQAKLSQ